MQALQDEISSWRLNLRFRVPLTESSLIAEIHRVGRVHDVRYEAEAAVIIAHVPPELEQKLARFAEK